MSAIEDESKRFRNIAEVPQEHSELHGIDYNHMQIRKMALQVPRARHRGNGRAGVARLQSSCSKTSPRSVTSSHSAEGHGVKTV